MILICFRMLSPRAVVAWESISWDMGIVYTVVPEKHLETSPYGVQLRLFLYRCNIYIYIYIYMYIYICNCTYKHGDFTSVWIWGSIALIVYDWNSSQVGQALGQKVIDSSSRKWAIDQPQP